MPHTESALRSLLDDSVTRRWSPNAKHLPFYAQLHLTVLAASADEGLHDEGDFRRRLAQMLGLPERDYVSRGCLPKLWLLASSWSHQRAGRHQDTRRLILPDPGNERIIGYSKLLAFPSFRDQNRLAELFSKFGVDASTPLLRLIEAIHANQKHFSDRFREEFSFFTKLCARGDRAGALDTPFWAAVVETTWLRLVQSGSIAARGCRLEIDPIDPYGPGFWLYGPPSMDLGEKWSLDPDDRLTDALFGWHHPDNPSADWVFDFLRNLWRQGSNRDHLGDRIGRPLLEGCIGFVQDDEGRWFDTPSLPEAGLVWLALQRSHSRLLEAPSGRPPGSIVYRAPMASDSSWILFGPIEVTTAVRSWFEANASTLDFFAPRLLRRQVTPVGTIRCPDGAHLYLPPLLPAFRCPDASGGYAILESGKELGPWPLDPQENLLLLPALAYYAQPPEFMLRVVTTDATGKTLATGRFRFRATSEALKYKQVPPDGHWLESNLQGRLVTYTPHPGSVPDMPTLPPALRATPPLLPLSASGDSGCMPLQADPADVDVRWWNAIEILSAIFSRRYALPLMECIDLLEAIWGSRGAAWSRLSDLMDNGILRLLHGRHWSHSVVVAGRPCVISHERSGSTSIRIIGLLSSAMRGHAASILGAHVQVAASPDLGTAGVLLWEIDGLDRLDNLSSEFGWPISARENLVAPATPPLRDVFQTCARVDFQCYDPQKRSIWSPTFGAFVSGLHLSPGQPGLERWRITGQQALYVFHHGDGRTWNTDCRIWALLAFLAETQNHVGSVCEDGTVHLAGPYLVLPRPLPWYNLALGGGVCFRAADGSRIYPAGDEWSLAAALSTWIGDKKSAPAGTIRRKVARDRYAMLVERKRQAYRHG